MWRNCGTSGFTQNSCYISFIECCKLNYKTEAQIEGKYDTLLSDMSWWVRALVCPSVTPDAFKATNMMYNNFQSTDCAEKDSKMYYFLGNYPEKVKKIKKIKINSVSTNFIFNWICLHLNCALQDLFVDVFLSSDVTFHLDELSNINGTCRSSPISVTQGPFDRWIKALLKLCTELDYKSM